MLVRCPKCRTTYKVSDDLLKGNSTAFRCSRCKHTFEMESPNPEFLPDPPAVDNPAATPPVDAEPSLPFESKPASNRPTAAIDSDGAPSVAAPAERPTNLESGDQWSLSETGPVDERQFELPESVQPIETTGAADTPQDFPADDPFFPNAQSEANDDSNNILAISTYREQHGSVLPFMTLFGLLIIAFSMLSVFSYTKPQASERIIKTIPVIGNSVLKNNYLKDGILIQSLRSGYQTIQGNREVFLISGVAVNRNPVLVREVKLSSISYNDAGKELEKQTIWVGNTISPKIIRGMTLEDIPHLQNLKPLKSFEIPAGDSIPFTIVFLKSAKLAKEFSCDVLTAEGAT